MTKYKGGLVMLLGVAIYAPAVFLTVEKVKAASENQTLTLCVKHSGVAFVVGKGYQKSDCRQNERLISINLSSGAVGQQGPVGDKGPTGDAGPVGVQGPAGVQGAPGLQGTAGEKGPAGEKGAIGDQGLIGLQGLAGEQGAVGAKGQTGDKGPVGDQGPVGPPGPQGIQGIQGEQGLAGPSGSGGTVGPQGPAGPQGIQGPVGPVGPQGEKGDTGATGAIGPQGAKGDTGAQGSQGLPGVGGSLIGVTLFNGIPVDAASHSTGGKGIATVTCPPGRFLLGGGGQVTNSENNPDKTFLTASYPSNSTTWTAIGVLRTTITSTAAMTVTAYAICSP